MERGPGRLAARGAAGFSLLEVVVGLAVVAAIAVILSAFGLASLRTTTGEAAERESDAVTAELVPVVFGRDVQGAAGLAPDPCPGGAGPVLVSLRSSVDPGDVVTYTAASSPGGSVLVRSACTAGSDPAVQVVAQDLAVAPQVSCDGGPCDAAVQPTPRTVELRTGRRTQLPFRIAAASRTVAGAVAPPLSPRLFSLGGSTPLAVSGNGSLTVAGDALVNSASPSAVAVSGANARLAVTGSFRILEGGGCAGCSPAKVSPFPPGSFSDPLPDPLAHLATPSESLRPVGRCTAGLCTPGVYAGPLSISGGDVRFEPGVYLLRKGMSVTGQATVRGDGVTLFNGCGTGAPPGCASSQGSFSISGQATVRLAPATSGPYRGILLFQSRSNTATGSISGGAQTSSYGGILYSPSGGFSLAAGGGGLDLGAVVGRDLAVSGNGTVRIGG